MKKLTIFYIFIVTAMLSCTGRKSEKTGDLSEISFESGVYDYGDIEYGANGKCSFEFTNTSEVNLIVNNVKPACGCTNADWTKDPVRPGEKGIINVTYNTTITGKFRKSVTVYSNAENSPYVLYITGQVQKPPQSLTKTR